MKKRLTLGKKTLVMGILNVTPDSFSDGGLYFDKEKAVKRTEEMIKEGADIIDIGGESTRPGSAMVTLNEELRRVISVVKQVRKKFGEKIIISIDTYRSEIARQALDAGVNIVNSLGGFLLDKKLADIVAKFKCPMIIYHIKGKPKTMQKGKITYKDVILDIKRFFEKEISFGVSKGIKKDQFLIDLGIGFGKTVEQNLEIIKRLDELKSLDLQIVIGVSRKSHLAKVLQDELKLTSLPLPTERIEASLAETAVAVLNGVKIVRTHDVLQTKKFLAVLDKLKE